MAKGSLSVSATLVLQALASGYQYGFDVMEITGLPGGTVYPSLRRLEDAGYVQWKWEKHQIAQRENRPTRKYYELTREGESALGEALKRYRILAHPLNTTKPRSAN